MGLLIRNVSAIFFVEIVYDLVHISMNVSMLCWLAVKLVCDSNRINYNETRRLHHFAALLG